MDAQALAVSAGAIATGVSAMFAAAEYRIRQSSERAESDTKLATLFSELVRVANGYTLPVEMPDALATALIQAGLITRDDIASGKAGFLLSGAMLSPPTGLVMQCAAMRSIAGLGMRHEVLLQPARSAISALSYFANEPGPGKDAWEASSAALQAHDGKRKGKLRRSR